MLNTSGCAFSISSSSTTEYGPAAHRFGELAALVVADVAGRRADEARHGELLHVLAHVDAHHRLLVVEQELGERPRQLGLADAGRAEEHERPDRAVRVGQPGTAAADRVGDGGDRVVLADDALVEQLFEVDELRRLRLHQAVERDAGGLGDDLGDVLGVDLLLEHRTCLLESSRCGGRLLDATLQFGDAAVADLGGDGQVGLALDLRAQPLELLLQRADRVDRLLLLLPVLLISPTLSR